MANFNPRSYGAAVDGQQVFDAVTTPGGTHVTSASGLFVVGDVGKAIWVTVPNGAVIPQTTIASFVSPNEVVVTSGASLSLAGSGQRCVWGTDDTAAFVSAYNAAVSPITQNTVIVPGGQSLISGRIYNCTGGIPPNLVGEAGVYSVLLVSPSLTIPGDGTAPIVNARVGGALFKDMTLWGPSSMYTAAANNQSLLDFVGASYSVLENIQMLQFGCTNATTNMIRFKNCSSVRLTEVETYTTFGTANGSQMTGILLDGTTGLAIQTYGSNVWRSVAVTNNMARDGIAGHGAPLTFIGNWLDECGSAANFDVFNNGEVNIVSMNMWTTTISGVTSGALHVDGTSRAYVTDCSLGPYNAGNHGPIYAGLVIEPGGEVRASGTTFHCSSLSNNISVDNRGKFFDLGGNDYKNAGAGGAGVPVYWRTAFTNPNNVFRD
jgi:hypothetical protein